MRSLEFRFCYVTSHYDTTVAFYRDELQFEVYHSWDRSPGDRGTIFRSPSGTGFIEVQAGTGVPSLAGGVYVEVTDLDARYARVREARAPIVQELGVRTYGHRSFKTSDPNGVEVGFFEYVMVPPHAVGS